MEPTSNTLLAISLIGFGVQQFLQVVADPLVAVLISHVRKRQAAQARGVIPGTGGVVAHMAGAVAQPVAAAGVVDAQPIAIGIASGTEPPALPGGISETDAKKAILGLVAFLLGLVIVRAAGDGLLLLKALGLDSPSRGLDQAVSALTLAAGTEGANSVLKLLQYAKDVVKARTPEKVQASTTTTTTVTGTSTGTGGR